RGGGVAAGAREAPGRQPARGETTLERPVALDRPRGEDAAGAERRLDARGAVVAVEPLVLPVDHPLGAVVDVEQNGVPGRLAVEQVGDVADVEPDAGVLERMAGQVAEALAVPPHHG